MVPRAQKGESSPRRGAHADLGADHGSRRDVGVVTMARRKQARSSCAARPIARESSPGGDRTRARESSPAQVNPAADRARDAVFGAGASRPAASPRCRWERLLMNYMGIYVGTLAAAGARPALTMILAWHPWEVIRVISLCDRRRAVGAAAVQARTFTGRISRGAPAQPVVLRRRGTDRRHRSTRRCWLQPGSVLLRLVGW